MGSISTAMCTSFKSELFAAGHCFNGQVTPTGNTNSTTAVSSVSSMAGVAVGMTVTGSGIPTSPVTYVAAITSDAAFVLSQAATSTVSSNALTITGDTFNIALITGSPTNSYGATNVNYSDIGSDEVSGTGYTTGGVTLTNVSPTTSGTTAYITFSANPSWTSATFTSLGCMIYNASPSARLASISTNGTGRACSVHSFGSAQSVSSGTFTIVMPTSNSVSAILRLE